MSSFTRAVFEAFPESRDRVEALIGTSFEFAELCENYDEVVAAHRLAADTRNESPLGPAVEYHALRLELEVEILESLERSLSARGDQRTGGGTAQGQGTYLPSAPPSGKTGNG